MGVSPRIAPPDHPGLASLISELRSQRSLSLNDVAQRVRRAAAVEGVFTCSVTRHTVHKWERGTVPRADSLRWLAAALAVPVEELVAVIRGGEDGGLEAVKRRTFLHTSAALAGAAMIAPIHWIGRPPPAPDGPPELAALRDALLRPAAAGGAAAPLVPAALAARVESVWRVYQDGRYSTAIRRLPDLLDRAHAATREWDGEERAQAQRSLAETYRLVAGALRKLGDRGLSAIAADRSMQAAQAGGDPLDVASSARCLCIALFETGHHGRAIELATAAAGALAGDRGVGDDSPERLSVHGLLMLAGAEAAADRGDRAAADELFREAELAAGRLGRDANHRHTAFGPTNVVVHRIHAAVLLDQPEAAVARSRAVDLDRLPVAERRAHHLLDVALGHGHMGRRDQALATLLQAERIAPDEVRLDAAARGLVADLLRRARRSSAELRGLGGRVGLPL